MDTKHTVAILPGDGIGPEIVAEAVKVLDTLQVNMGYRCNQSCLHCHVDAGPTRREEMEHRAFVEQIIDFLEIQAIRKTVLDTWLAEHSPPEYV